MEVNTCAVGGINPVLLPYTNNPVSIGGYGTTKGIALTIGQPNQFFSVKPGANQNNTFVVNTNYCQPPASNWSCIAENGGVYDPALSPNTNTTNNAASWNGTQMTDEELGSDFRNIYFNDRFVVGGHEIPGVPFFTYENEDWEFTQPSCLALGINSSFLEAALASSVIPTKQWSLWPGNVHESLDGLLILGGYDDDRRGSAFIEMPVEDHQPLYIEVTGLDWEHSSGKVTDLMPNDTARMIGALEPFFDWIDLPFESYSTFHDITNGTYNYTVGRYIYEKKPTGTLIVTLSNGMKTTIPSDDLFDYPEAYDEKGRLGSTTYDYHEAKVYSSLTYPEGVLWFGQPFLTQKLLVTDFENGRYFLADAVKQDLGSGARHLKPLCTGGPPPAGETYTDPAILGTPKKKTNVAAIAGGVGGGIGGLLVIALIAFFVLRRRKQKNQAAVQRVPYLPEITQTQTEPPCRGSTMSPPPKYMTSGVYETGISEQQQPQRYQSPPPPHQSHLHPVSSELASPRSDTGTASQWGGSDNRTSQAGVSASGNDSKYEMSSENRFTAVNGPFEMPNEYGYDERGDRRPDH